MRNAIRTKQNGKRLGRSVWALVVAVCFLLAFSLIGLLGRFSISHTYAAEVDGEEITETVEGEVTDASDNAEVGDNEGEVEPPADNAGDNEGEVAPPADNTGDDEGETIPPEGNAGDDEGEVTPPENNAGDDEGEVTPPENNAGDDEGEVTPPVSGSENYNGNTDDSKDGAAGTTDSANGIMGFLQNYWWVLAIAGAVLLIVIFSIVGAKRSKKHKRLVEDKRLQALDEERERQERLEAERKEERRMEQEARMEAMRQQQMMQQQMMPMMPQMMMPQMPMQQSYAQQPVQQIQQLPAQSAPQQSYGDGSPSFELMRMAEEKARAEERARLAEERVMRYMQDQRLRDATLNVAPQATAQYQQQPAHDPAEERLRAAEERARKAEQRLLLLEEERLKQQAIKQAPAAQEKPKEVTIKLTENAVNMLSGALAGLVGAQQVPVQQAQPMQGSPVTVQFVQPAPNVQYVPVQQPQPAQTTQSAFAPAAQENGQSEESAPIRRRLRL